ncbi:hypothetical protein ABGN78_004955 [Escherichia coli]|uniref:hypothetical protein n=1 Tax=Escherichia coli TaxID=562 RepID=UPI00050B1267|nr:hypothetical protein [Escherichia coli]EIH7250232.1 hypothetical protein [Escherichia coli]EKD0818382.1 hypothetical protein [Escherichia coli]MDA6709550.1 hypothetical protein [Escherichia coli]HCI7669376.1 hypothetical protein [Escherichia coli]HCO3687905.1 hypothetical protein [Escherichia coli]
MIDIVACIMDADFDNIIKIASDMDLSQIKDIVREAQEDINSNGPAWSSWS